MRYYTNRTVLDAAKDRIRWLFAEFKNIRVAYSGGKDSTAILHLALEVARELGRLPLTVMFIDQEAEWAATIDQVRSVMEHPDVDPRWYQMPFRLFNATSTSEHWLQCWDPAEEHRWMRPRESYSIHENVYGCDRFHDLFNAILKVEYPKDRVCMLGGVRVEESPSRAVALTHQATYKWATWGKVLNKGLGHYTMYPLYDWGMSDIWKYIFENDLPYNDIYNAQFRYGIHPKDMRVSNVHHETAVQHLWYMQEVEGETYERLTARISGIDTAAKLGKSDFFVSELPHMFSSWREYRDYLLENLVDNEKWKAGWRHQFMRHDDLYLQEIGEEKLCRVHINSVLTQDHEFVKLKNLESQPKFCLIRKRRNGRHVY